MLAACAAEQLRPSEWLRRAVRRALEGQQEGAGNAGAPSGAVSRLPAPVAPGRGIHVELDAAASQLLDDFVVRGHYRTRVAALRALLEGLAPAKGSDLADAAKALGLSNHSLVNLSRDLSRVLSRIDEGVSPAAVAQRLAIERAVEGAWEHLRVASELVALLRRSVTEDKE